MAWLPYLIVFAGAGVGGAMRHGMNELVTNFAGIRFPWGILAINVSGSLLLGLFAGYFAFRGEASQHWRLFLTTGICGGYTTFSTFSLDSVLLWERGEATMAVLYVVASVSISIAALVLGMWAMRG